MEITRENPHPYDILEAWAEHLEPREEALLRQRASTGRNQPSLRKIGQEFGITSERTRQIESRLRRNLDRFIMESREGLPVKLMAQQARRELGTAASGEYAKQLLRPPQGSPDHRATVLRIAGPYRQLEDGWLILESAAGNDPTPRILERTNGMGGIDMDLARSQLNGWGLPESRHREWLLRHPKVRDIHGILTVGADSLNARMVIALDQIGEPAPMERILEHLGERTTRDCAITAAGMNPRMMRVTRDRWGLDTWGMPRYTGTAQAMRLILDEEEGQAELGEVIRRMEERFGVDESSVRAFAKAPIFIRYGKWIRLRKEEDGPLRCSAAGIQRAPGVFDLGPGRLGRAVWVTRDTLRGSGMNLKRAAGGVLGMKAGDRLEFRDRHGDAILLTFPETSPSPNIGSIKSTAERLGARLGNLITLVFNRPDLAFHASLTTGEEMRESWETVGRLTGIGASAGPVEMAGALHCRPGEVRTVLERRGDITIMECLPENA